MLHVASVCDKIWIDNATLHLFGDSMSGFDIFCGFNDVTMFLIYSVSSYMTW